MDLSHLLTSRTVAWIGLVCIALSALAALWAMVKLSYQRALGKPMPRNGLTATLDVLAELAVNVVGAVSRALKLGTGESLFRATVPLTPAERGVALPAEKQGALDVSSTRPVDPPLPTPADGVEPFDPHARQTIIHDAARQPIGPVTIDTRKGEGGYATGGAMLAACGLMLMASLALALAGCPRNPPVSGCQPEAQTCIGDRPHVCSASQRWHRVGNLQCSAVGGQCTVLGGRAYCGPVADAGVADGGE